MKLYVVVPVSARPGMTGRELLELRERIANDVEALCREYGCEPSPERVFSSVSPYGPTRKKGDEKK